MLQSHLSGHETALYLEDYPHGAFFCSSHLYAKWNIDLKLWRIRDFLIVCTWEPT